HGRAAGRRWRASTSGPVHAHSHARRAADDVGRTCHEEHFRRVEPETLKRHPIGKRIGLVCARVLRRDHELEATRSERGEPPELSRAVRHHETSHAVKTIEHRWNVWPSFELAPAAEELGGAFGVDADRGTGLADDLFERPVRLPTKTILRCGVPAHPRARSPATLDQSDHVSSRAVRRSKPTAAYGMQI